jgi:hypothetical protein
MLKSMLMTCGIAMIACSVSVADEGVPLYGGKGLRVTTKMDVLSSQIPCVTYAPNSEQHAFTVPAGTTFIATEPPVTVTNALREADGEYTSIALLQFDLSPETAGVPMVMSCKKANIRHGFSRSEYEARSVTFGPYDLSAFVKSTSDFLSWDFSGVSDTQPTPPEVGRLESAPRSSSGPLPRHVDQEVLLERLASASACERSVDQFDAILNDLSNNAVSRKKLRLVLDCKGSDLYLRLFGRTNGNGYSASAANKHSSCKRLAALFSQARDPRINIRLQCAVSSIDIWKHKDLPFPSASYSRGWTDLNITFYD